MSDQPAELQFLVTGTARSGTTLVQRLACELPGVWIPQETHFWTEADTLEAEFDWPLRGDDRLAAAERLLELIRDAKLAVDAPAITKQMMGRHRRIGLWTLFESLIAALSPPDRAVLGEKTPNHTFWWEHLKLAVPGLKLIGVVRDPADVLRSHRSVSWGEHDAHVFAERWIAHQRIVLDAHRTHGSGTVLLLRHSDIVADYRAVRSRIAGFLGVEDTPSKLKRSLLAEYPLFPSREKWKGRALKAISMKRTGQTDELPDADQAIIAAACADLAAAIDRRIDDPVPPIDGDSQDRVRSFRRWQTSVAGSNELPIY